jgi:hypothetical protein
MGVTAWIFKKNQNNENINVVFFGKEHHNVLL